ncbi:hypothetical protein DY000_02056023 [Brassica cretica]|uniref:Uncharacterized protein n=1 Tax=Brassica cretica TaxID=69181 RepID=A0ABQ7A8U3_BRACR|nr:hypothetical protein DY000_02056023 [Brassica cretica]
MATDGTTFPEGDAEAELNPGQNKSFEVDPVSSEIASDKRVQIWSKASSLRIEAESLKSDFIGVDFVRSTVCGGGFGVTGCSEYESVLYGLFGLAVVLRRVNGA